MLEVVVEVVTDQVLMSQEVLVEAQVVTQVALQQNKQVLTVLLVVGVTKNKVVQTELVTVEKVNQVVYFMVEIVISVVVSAAAAVVTTEVVALLMVVKQVT